MERGSHIPIQYKAANGMHGCLVISNTDEDRALAGDVMRKLLGVSTEDGGVLTFGPPGTSGEALAYNQGYGAGISAHVFEMPDLVDPDSGEILIKGKTKRIKK